MKKMLDNDQAERAPELQEHEERWYLPVFGVYHPQKPILRFLWYKDNDLTKEIVEFRMKVHVFGNSPSPSVAICGLRRAAQEDQDEYGTESKEFVTRNFYVDDRLTSVATEPEAVDLLKKTQELLAASNIKLHKIASNSSMVMQAFPSEDLAKDLKDLKIGTLPCAHNTPFGTVCCCFSSRDVRHDPQ